jgi:hypothetical protein
MGEGFFFRLTVPDPHQSKTPADGAAKAAGKKAEVKGQRQAAVDAKRGERLGFVWTHYIFM